MLCNIVVISMRACDREKSETLVHAALKESLARVGLWYMGSHALTWYPKFSSLDPLGNVCTVCSVCPRLHKFYQVFHDTMLGRRPVIFTGLRVGWERCVCTFFAPRIYSTTRR